MGDVAHCPACGAPIPAQNAAGESCPACLVRLGLAASASSPAVSRDQAAHDGSGGEPRDFDPYTILRLLGEGGMGSVYLAEQRAPLRRRIALKIIKRGMDSAAVIRRFEGERQALALMSHPAIARVFDASETPDGRPYFAMEYVDGEAITAYCDRRLLTTRARLELFAQVCDGIQHAHHKGVIHRDIKPSNILVSEEGGRPAPKIIDFGIAKAIGERLTERTLVTDLGVLVGTPEYMSPEQTEITALDVDARTDVYSLGVLLYRLLTGALPFDLGDRMAPGLEGLRRRIREETPSRPSVRLATLKDAAREEARLRSTEPPLLRRQIRGDLDWIAMKALEKERGRRYDSPAALAADVRRHLASEPVLARPPSAIYQLRRFARRNRIMVGGIAATFVALLAGVVVSTTLGLREAKQRREAEQARDDLQQVVRFQADMLVRVDPEEAGKRLFAQIRERIIDAARLRDPAGAEGGTAGGSFDRMLADVNPTDVATTMLESNILVPAAEALEADYADRPLLQAQLRMNVGVNYAQLGQFEAAAKQMEPAVETIVRLRGRDHPDTLRAFDRLARLHLVRGMHQEAIALYRETIDAQRRILGVDHPNTLESMSNLGWVLDGSGRYEEAETLLKEVVERRRHVLGEDHYDTLVSMNRVGTVLLHRGRYEEAERWQKETIEKMSRARGEDDPQTLHAMISLAGTYQELGRFAESERLDLRALEGLRRAYGDEHIETLQTMNSLGFSYQRMGRFEEARRMQAEVLATAERVLGTEHGTTIMVTADLAGALDGLCRYRESEPLHRRAVEASRRILGEDDFTSLFALNGQAMSYLRQRRYAEAEPLLLRTIEGRRQTLGNDAEETLQSLGALVSLHLALGRLEEAEVLGTELADTRQRLHGPSHPETLSARTNVAILHGRRGRSAEAAAQFRDLLPEVRRVLGANHPRTSVLEIAYASFLLTAEPAQLRDPALALELALAGTSGSPCDDPEALDVLALAYLRTDDREKAMATQQRAINALRPDETELLAEYRRRLALHSTTPPGL